MSVVIRDYFVREVNNTNTIDLVKPPSVQIGDLLIVQVGSEGTEEAARVNLLSGWTQIFYADDDDVPNAQTSDSTDRAHYVFYRIAGASEPRNYLFTNANGQNFSSVSASLTVIAGADQTNPIQSNGVGTVSGGSISLTNALDPNYTNIWFVHTRTGSNISFSGDNGGARVWVQDAGFPTILTLIANVTSLTFNQTAVNIGASGFVTRIKLAAAVVVTPPPSPPPPTPTPPPPTNPPPPTSTPAAPLQVNPTLNFRAQPNLITTSRPNRYSSLHLTWLDVTQGGASSYTGVAIQRSNTGPPSAISEGTSVFSLTTVTTWASDDLGYWTLDSSIWQAAAIPVTESYDYGLNTGDFYYYSLFGYNGTTWVKLDEANGLVPSDYAFDSQFMSWTPGIFKNSEREVAGQPSQGDSDLFKLYGVLGFVTDYTRTYIETLNNAYDPQKVGANLLPALAGEFGLNYETEAGASRNRKLASDAIDIWQNKGNARGLETYLTDLSGYGIQIYNSKNLLLDRNDYSLKDQTVGSTPNNANYNWYVTGTSAPNPTVASGTILGPTGATGTNKYLSFTHTGAGTEIMQYGGSAAVGITPAQVRSNSIKLPYNTDIYCMSFYMPTAAPANLAVTGLVGWYDKNAVFISNTSKAATIYSTSFYEATHYPPSNAVYAVPKWVFTGTTGGTVTVAYPSFEQSGTRTNAQITTVPYPPNTVYLFVNPTRQNFIEGVDLTGPEWTYTGTTSNTGIATVEPSGSLTGTNSFTATSSRMRVSRGRDYTFSIYAIQGLAGVTAAQVSINWYNGPTDADLLTSNVVNSTGPFTAWTRLSITASSPIGARFARCVVTVTGGGGSTLILNGPLFEQSPTALTYFGGSTSAFVAASTQDIRVTPLYTKPKSTSGLTISNSSTEYYRSHDVFLPGIGGTPGRIIASIDDTVAQGLNKLLPVGASYEYFEHADPTIIGSVYTRNNLWLYDVQHSWYNGLAECWGTDDVWTGLWVDLLTHVDLSFTWQNELFYTWDDQSLQSNTYFDLYINSY